MGSPGVTHRRYRNARAQVLAESDTCHLCGHAGADAADHLVPRSRGGAVDDPNNLAPIHGVAGCPTCGRKCNSERGAKPLSAVRVPTSIDWYA
ncbi:MULTISPECIES: HNH endonuclease [unclassified Frankia]|uniref:HNH endonuclease n=1 Tax=unclassified Frankia TaxID=2632575 RepID=UPI0019347AF2|nr:MULTISPECIES: HNH endonuclease [unclassified Frankia]